MRTRACTIIDAPSDLGLRRTGVDGLPEALRAAGLVEGLPNVRYAGRLPVPASTTPRWTTRTGPRRGRSPRLSRRRSRWQATADPRSADARLCTRHHVRTLTTVGRRHLPVRTRGRVYFLDIDDIDWLEAADNYVKIHANRETHVIRQTLQRLEASLSPRGFIRVHRSAIVNIARIREIQPWFGGDYIPAINLCVAGNSLGSSVARP